MQSQQRNNKRKKQEKKQLTSVKMQKKNTKL